MGRVKWFRNKAVKIALRGALDALKTFIDFIAPYVMNNRKKKKKGGTNKGKKK